MPSRPLSTARAGCSAVLMALLTLVSAAAEPVETLGVVKTKPTTGPWVKIDGGYMVPYTDKIHGTDITFEMVPIPGGVVKVGSPADEPGRQEVEGPQFEVELSPIWIGRYEVTWAEYKEFMRLYAAFKTFESNKLRQVNDDNLIDTVTAPTELYEPTHTFEHGEDPKQPAITMTQYAARQYTKWLSLMSGRFYRIPSEAEWEHACRAGAQTAYHFGDDPAQLGEYAWFADNGEETTHLVGQKKPNAWGLYDMHGNVSEWVMDQLHEDGYARFKGGKVPFEKAIVWPTLQNSRVVKGGHWGSPAEECRVASRLPSDYPAWREYDPNLPRSPWWMTTDPARGVGMRVVRQLEIPDREVREKFWKADSEDDLLEIEIRLGNRKGIAGLVDPDLPAAIKKLDE